MKKYIYFPIIVLAAMAVSSCSQTEDLLPDSNDLQTVTISLAPETGMQLRSGSPGTRAGETISVDRYVMEIYESDNDTPTKETNNTGVFTLTLDRTKEYTCLFWADENNGIYDADNLKAVTLNTDEESGDYLVATGNAYYGTLNIDAAQATHTVILKRAVSKLYVYNVDPLVADEESATITNSAFTTFNVSTGEASDEQEMTWTAPLTDKDGGEDAAPFITIYQLAPADGTTVDIGIDVTYEEGTTMPSPITVTSVPLRANYVTHLRGGLSKVISQQFSISVDKEWAGDDETSFGE